MNRAILQIHYRKALRGSEAELQYGEVQFFAVINIARSTRLGAWPNVAIWIDHTSTDCQHHVAFVRTWSTTVEDAHEGKWQIRYHQDEKMEIIIVEATDCSVG
jgi:hypothetical protein